MCFTQHMTLAFRSKTDCLSTSALNVGMDSCSEARWNDIPCSMCAGISLASAQRRNVNAFLM